MGTRYYGGEQGEQKEDISVATSTTSKPMELTVDDASGLTKEDVYKFLDEAKARVLEDDGFPGA